MHVGWSRGRGCSPLSHPNFTVVLFHSSQQKRPVRKRTETVENSEPEIGGANLAIWPIWRFWLEIGNRPISASCRFLLRGGDVADFGHHATGLVDQMSHEATGTLAEIGHEATSQQPASQWIYLPAPPRAEHKNPSQSSGAVIRVRSCLPVTAVTGAPTSQQPAPRELPGRAHRGCDSGSG